MTAASLTKSVKSAERALRLLEYFNDQHFEATVMDISRALDMPQSSTSELLKCMTSLGYLAYDSRRRSYRPTARVAMLGAWVQPRLFRRGKLFGLMDDLASATGWFVAAGMLVGLDVRYIHVIQSKKLQGPRFADSLPYTPHTAMGRALLSTMPDKMVGKFVHRFNAEAAPHWRVQVEPFLTVLSQVREQGYALTMDTVWPNGGMLCVPLPDTGDGQRLAVGIGAESGELRKDAPRIAALLRKTVERYFYPRSLRPVAAPLRTEPA